MSPDRRLYEDNVPYDVPRSLDALTGPAHGHVELPLHIFWGPVSDFDLDDEGSRRAMYLAVIRVGRSSDQEALLNRALLTEIWSTLVLPARCRQTWEEAFPELVVG